MFILCWFALGPDPWTCAAGRTCAVTVGLSLKPPLKVRASPKGYIFLKSRPILDFGVLFFWKYVKIFGRLRRPFSTFFDRFRLTGGQKTWFFSRWGYPPPPPIGPPPKNSSKMMKMFKITQNFLLGAFGAENFLNYLQILGNRLNVLYLSQVWK